MHSGCGRGQQWSVCALTVSYSYVANYISYAFCIIKCHRDTGTPIIKLYLNVMLITMPIHCWRTPFIICQFTPSINNVVVPPLQNLHLWIAAVPCKFPSTKERKPIMHTEVKFLSAGGHWGATEVTTAWLKLTLPFTQCCWWGSHSTPKLTLLLLQCCWQGSHSTPCWDSIVSLLATRV